VASAILYDIVANVAAIPASPVNNDAVEITNSTGIESFTPLVGVPGGFVGNSGLSVRIVYTTVGSTWNWIQYFPNDPETRYLKLGGGTLTGAVGVTAGTAAAPSVFISGDPNTGIYSPGADQVAISTNGTGRLSIGSAGSVNITSTLYVDTPNFRVGIGTASPSEKLTVSGGSIDLPTVNSFIKGGGHNVLQVDATRTYFYGGTGGVQLRTADNTSDLINITNAGLVGLGNSTPGSFDSGANQLVVGSGTGNNGLTLYSGSSSSGNIYFADGTAGSAPYIGFIQYRHDDNSLRLGTNDNTRLTIDSSGRCGIGTTTPGRKLSIADSVAPTLGFYRGSTEDGLISSEAAGLVIQTFNNTPIQFSVVSGSSGYSERARIDSSGRLLVGTSSARTGFQISTGFGNVTPVHQFEFNSQTYNGVSITHNAGANTYPAVLAFGKSRGSSAGSYTAVASGDGLGWLDFYGADGTNMVRAATISTEVDGTPGANDMPGRLVFSTTADGASSPTERMRINNLGWIYTYSTGGNALTLSSSRASGTSDYLLIGTSAATGIDSGTTRILVYTNGNVQNTNNSYAGISDIKLKENIVDAASQWEDLKALQVRKYNFKEETGQQTHTQIGLIAQEVELVSPGLVIESPDRDENNNDLGTVTKSVNYSVLYMKAVKALQEAMERIETLEAKVAALEAV
jgi:hypothetical protein